MTAVLTIAGTDPTSGAGITADARVCYEYRVHAAITITAVVAQSTERVHSFIALPPEHVSAQIDALTHDFSDEIAAVKVGMLATPDIARVVGTHLARFRSLRIPVVVDPVLAANSGDPLAKGSLRDALLEHILPHAWLLTPNIPEAEAFTGEIITLETSRDAAERLLETTGAHALLLKGGHLPGTPGDVLCIAGEPTRFLTNTHIVEGTSPHGTGCHLSTAIACALACGVPLVEAVEQARTYLDNKRVHRRWRPGLGRAILAPEWWVRGER